MVILGEDNYSQQLHRIMLLYLNLSGLWEKMHTKSKKESGRYLPQRCVCKDKLRMHLLVYQGTFVRGPREPSIYLTLGSKMLWLAKAAVGGPSRQRNMCP